MPIGQPVHEGRLYLGRQRMALRPGACGELVVLTGFSTAAWLGRPETPPPALGKLVSSTSAVIDGRHRVMLDRRARTYLAVADTSRFDVVVLRAPGGGLLLVPTDDFERRIAAVA